MKKKLLPLLLALVLLLSLATPAMAATDAEKAMDLLETVIASGEADRPPVDTPIMREVALYFFMDLNGDGIPELLRILCNDKADVLDPKPYRAAPDIRMDCFYVLFGSGGISGYARADLAYQMSGGSGGNGFYLVQYDDGSLGIVSWWVSGGLAGGGSGNSYRIYVGDGKTEEIAERPYTEINWWTAADPYQFYSRADAAAATVAAPTAAAPAVQRSAQSLSVNGQTIDCEKYNIDGSNYFKLRDLAMLLNGTAAQFSVGWDDATKTVSITTGAAYTPVGGELDADADNSATAVPSSQKVTLNGADLTGVSAYNIGGNNYFKLRDLGEKLGFTVDYDEATNTAIVKSAEQFIGEHTAASSVTDGEYTVKFTGTHQSVQGGELVDVELIENVCFTDEEIQEFLAAGTFPIGKYYPYAVKDELPISQSDFSGSFIHLEDFQLYKSKDGLWHLALANDVSITRTVGTGQLFFPADIKVKDASGNPFDPVTHENIVAVFRKGTPRNNAHVVVEDGAVIICTIGYRP